MSWTKQVTLWCDVESCNEFLKVDGGSVASARRHAKQNTRWKTGRNGPDICGEHSGLQPKDLEES